MTIGVARGSKQFRRVSRRFALPSNGFQNKAFLKKTPDRKGVGAAHGAAQGPAQGTFPAQDAAQGTVVAQDLAQGTFVAQDVAQGTFSARDVAQGTFPAWDVAQGTVRRDALAYRSNGATFFPASGPWNQGRGADGTAGPYLYTRRDYIRRASPRMWDPRNGSAP